MPIMTVLVVEDAPSERELITYYLQQAGYQVISVDNAKEALTKTLETHPDVIITDVVMQGMSGLELCRSLKKNPATQSLPIIICSSKNQDLDRLWAKKQGADVYLTKPFSQEDIIQAIRQVFSPV